MEKGDECLYTKNAFRLLNISPQSDARGIKRRLDKIKMMQKLGTNTAPEKSILPLRVLPDADVLREAGQRLSNPEEKLVEEIFWFWPLSNTDSKTDPALIALHENDLNTALSYWSKQNDAHDIGLHNTAILYHALALDCESELKHVENKSKLVEKCNHYWQQSLNFWSELLKRENFWNKLNLRAQELNDPRITKETVLSIRSTFPEMLMMINAKLAINAAEAQDMFACDRHLEIMRNSEFDNTIIVETLHNAMKPLTHQIKLLCENAKAQAIDHPQTGVEIVESLLTQGDPLLYIVNQVYGKNDATNEHIHDDLASSALMCIINYVNETSDWQVCISLIERIKDKAYGLTARNNIDRNLKTIKGNLKAQEELAESKRCWFCKSNEMNEDSSFKINLYGEVNNRDTGYGEIERTWRHGTFTVPRCQDCANTHKDNFIDYIFKWIWYCASIGFILTLFSNFDWAGWSLNLLSGTVFFSGLSSIAGIIVGPIIAFYKISNNTIKPLSTKHDYPVIADLLKDGWSFGEQPPSD